MTDRYKAMIRTRKRQSMALRFLRSYEEWHRSVENYFNSMLKNCGLMPEGGVTWVRPLPGHLSPLKQEQPK